MKARKSNRKVSCIISGGQSGVDRAALDFALQNKISCGGWCPKGRIAEDGVIHSKYPLKETDHSDYGDRTQQNILSAEGSLILYSAQIDKGTQQTIDDSIKQNKPYLIIKLEEDIDDEVLADWIASNNISILNIAGPRESNASGIYHQTLEFLEQIKYLF